MKLPHRAPGKTGRQEGRSSMALPKQGFLRVAWSLAWPFWTGNEKWSARALLAAVVALNLTAVWLNVRLNAWNNDFYNALQEWLADQAYYRMHHDQSATDNPDQRIADDLDRFTSISLALSIGLLNAVVTLFSFLFILWTLSGVLSIPLGGDSHLDIPGYMVIAAIIYAAGGTW